MPQVAAQVDVATPRDEFREAHFVVWGVPTHGAT